MANQQSLLMAESIMNLVASLDKFFKKTPHLPKSWIKFLVKVIPWLSLIGGIFMIWGGLTSVGFLGNVGWLMGVMGISRTYFVISGLLSLASAVLLLMAFKPLQSLKLTGWMYLFWVSLLSALSGILSILMAFGSIVWFILGILLSFYLLFELKSEYK